MAGRVEWFDDLDAVAADAAGALDRAKQSSLFDRLDWYRLTAGHGVSPGHAEVLRAGDAWLFLSRIGRHRATPLGSWYSLSFGPIGAPADFSSLFQAVAERFGRLAIYPVADDARVAVAAALGEAGWRPFAAQISANWRIAIHEDFATYWAARPTKLRNTVARRARSHPLTIRIHRPFDAAAWADYEAVYAASWKPAEGSLPFLRALAKQEGAAGTLRLGIGYDPAGRAVATQFWLVENSVATIHKLAHREDAKGGSPGSILSHAMFRAAIDEDHVTAIDFGLGDEPYKADWMDRSEPVWRIDAYRPFTRHGALGIAREVGGRLARRLRRG